MTVQGKLLLLCTASGLFLTACKGTTDTIAATAPCKGSYTTEISMELEDMTAKGTLTRHEAGKWSMYFSEPSQLAGVNLDFLDQEVSASYKGLSFSVPQAAMPSKSLLTQCITVMDLIASQDEVSGEDSDESVILTGTLESGNYTLYLSNDGTPSAFQMDNSPGCITFLNFQAGAVEAAPESTTDTTAAHTETSTTDTETTMQESTEESQ